MSKELTNKDLHRIKEHYGLTSADIAALMGKPLNSAGGRSCRTVDSWLAKPESPSFRRMPSDQMKILHNIINFRKARDLPLKLKDREAEAPMPEPRILIKLAQLMYEYPHHSIHRDTQAIKWLNQMRHLGYIGELP